MKFIDIDFSPVSQLFDLVINVKRGEPDEKFLFKEEDCMFEITSCEAKLTKKSKRAKFEGTKITL